MLCDLECVHCEIPVPGTVCVYKAQYKGSVYTIRGTIYAKILLICWLHYQHPNKCHIINKSLLRDSKHVAACVHDLI